MLQRAAKRLREEDPCERSVALAQLYRELVRANAKFEAPPSGEEPANGETFPITAQALCNAVRTRTRQMMSAELFEQARAQDLAQQNAALQARLEEREAHMRTLAAENTQHQTVVKRAAALEQELFALQRQCAQLQQRVDAQAQTLATDYQARMAHAREAAMRDINEHYLALVQAPQPDAVVDHIDAIRSAVARHLL